MTDASDRLRSALADHYVLEGELGQGGMVTVYLARYQKHDRLIALKVLRTELAASLGPERFLREIHLTARLDHPHILPVHDSGVAQGFPGTRCPTSRASVCGTGSAARSSSRSRRRSASRMDLVLSQVAVASGDTASLASHVEVPLREVAGAASGRSS